jgi:hypothetical protein
VKYESILLSCVLEGSIFGWPLQLDHGTRRVAQIRAVGIFVIPRKVLNDGFAIDQEFECLPVDGKMFVLAITDAQQKTGAPIL